MTTTSSTTATSPSQIALTLGAGSGVDSSAIVTALVNAQFANKTAMLTTKKSALTTQISDVAKVQSGITGFATALGQLIGGGSLQTQPTTSNAAVAGVALKTDASLQSQSSTVAVTRLATVQSATTATPVASRSTAIGTGNLTLTFGTATVAGGAMTAFAAGAASPVTIAIDSAHQTLDGIAAAINAAKAGVTATIVTDVDGSARLTLKGATGSAQAFTLNGDTPQLSALDVGVGQNATTIGSAAGNAALSVDGVAVERATNTVDDLIDGVTLTLATVGTTQIGTTRPTTALSQAVSDFVDTYNQLHTEIQNATDPASGSLARDAAAATMSHSLAALTLSPLIAAGAAGAPTTLAEIGVATNRDGSLSVRADVLSAALAKWPDQVAAMFTTGSGATPGLGGALSAVSAAAIDAQTGLASSTMRYTAAQADISDAQSKLSTAQDTVKTRLTQQFSSMDARVAAYKSTQTFLQAQIDAWNKKS
ncbi:MAG: flagellar filament capping protein FliD [Sphingomonas sp.]